MEAYATKHYYGSNSTPYSSTQNSERLPILNIDQSEENTQREAYKVHWKIAIPLLILGVLPGLIYLGGIALLNCLGGKKVRVQSHNSMPTNPDKAQARSPQQYQRVITPKALSRLETDNRRPKKAKEREDRRPARSYKTIKNDRSKAQGARRQEKNPSVIDRVRTQNPSVSTIPQKNDASKRLVASEPTIQKGKISENIRQGRAAIAKASITDKNSAIRNMEKMAKILPYDKQKNPGSFQHWLNYAYPKK